MHDSSTHDSSCFAAALKRYAQAVEWMVSPTGARELPAPRGNYVVDACRSLVLVDRPSDLVDFYESAVQHFGGVTRTVMACGYGLAAHAFVLFLFLEGGGGVRSTFNLTLLQQLMWTRCHLRSLSCRVCLPFSATAAAERKSAGVSDWGVVAAPCRRQQRV